MPSPTSSIASTPRQIWVQRRLGLAWVGVYLLSGAICTLVALSLNRRLQRDDGTRPAAPSMS